MNFLQIVQGVDLALGTQGTISSVSGASGYQALLIDYVKNAWIDIQSRRKAWDFMKRSATITTVQGQTAYTVFEIFAVVDDPVATWAVDEFKHSTDQSFMRYVDPFRWKTRDLTNQRKPRDFTVQVNSTLGYIELDNPDAIYTIDAPYYIKPQILAENVDVPYAPVEFHRLIVHQASADIASYLGNMEAYDIHSTKAENQFGDLLRSQNPGLKAVPQRFI